MIAIFMQPVDDFTARRQYQQMLNKTDRKIFKGARFLLLSNYENLETGKKARLDELLQLNEPLSKMHLMKKQLRLFWDMETRQEARKFLNAWGYEAMRSGIPALAKGVFQTPAVSPASAKVLIIRMNHFCEVTG